MAYLQRLSPAFKSARIVSLPRPRLEHERGGEGTLVILGNGHGWLCGDRLSALREFAELDAIERWGST
jgi:hypothetical protein